MTKEELKLIHKHSYNNRVEIEDSVQCGCFNCLEMFSPEIISSESWYIRTSDPVEQTLLCPKCGIDSVIGTASGYELSLELLGDLKEYFFNSEI